MIGRARFASGSAVPRDGRHPLGTAPEAVLLTPGVSAEQQKRRARVRAPELVGRRWLNTGGREMSLHDFRGKVLVLDFWTF